MERGVTPGRLRLLAAEIRRDADVLDRVGAAIDKDAVALVDHPDERPLAAVLAVDLHRWYTGFEAVIERVERFFDLVPSGAEWHGELLSGALLDVPGVRPPIMNASREAGLRDLLRFRHFFRHAYVVELDSTKLVAVAGSHTAVGAASVNDLRHFAAVLDAMADRVAAE